MSVALYRRYRAQRKILTTTGQFMPYGWSPLPQEIHGVWFPYVTMFDEFARGLANAINDLTEKERCLRAWAIVVMSLTDDQKMTATHEFINSIATIAVNLPYTIKCRFYFADSHLCHQVNRLKIQGWIDDLPIDREINRLTANRFGKY